MISLRVIAVTVWRRNRDNFVYYALCKIL